MGLDQNAGKMMTMEFSSLKDKETGEPVTYEAYGPYDWRKHARLHMFMKDAWHRKNQDATDDEVHYFTEVELDIEDIDRLEKAINSRYRDYFCEGGFFFGHQWQEEAASDYKEQDLKFVEYAKKELAKGTMIRYNSSW